jgi:hypothetical protein
MQCENAVAAVSAVRGGVGALRSQKQPVMNAYRRTEEEPLLFHNAVSETACKSGTLPSRQ